MKTIVNYLVLFLSVSLVLAQESLNLNQGQPIQQDYFMSVPYQEVNGKIIIEASLDNNTYKFIVDTGAPTAISEELYHTLESQDLGTIPLSDQSGAIDSIRVVSVERITLGPIDFEKTPAIVAKQPQILFQCYGVQGIIGSNLLRNTTIQFNSNKRQLILTDNPKNLKLKKKEGSTMILSKTQSNPFIKIYLRNGKTYVNEEVLFDTGDNDIYTLSNYVLKNVPKDMVLFNTLYESTGSFSMGFHGTAKQENYLVVGVPQIEINGTIFKNVVTKTTYSETSRIGSNLLDYGIVTLDYPNKTFYFEPFTKQSLDVSQKIWSIDPVVQDQQVVVGIVWDPSLLDQVNVGDLILKSDDLDYLTLDLCDIVLGTKKTDKQKAMLVLKGCNYR